VFVSIPGYKAAGLPRGGVWVSGSLGLWVSGSGCLGRRAGVQMRGSGACETL
jgi:hypothetical protein